LRWNREHNAAGQLPGGGFAGLQVVLELVVEAKVVVPEVVGLSVTILVKEAKVGRWVAMVTVGTIVACDRCVRRLTCTTSSRYCRPHGCRRRRWDRRCVEHSAGQHRILRRQGSDKWRYEKRPERAGDGSQNDVRIARDSDEELRLGVTHKREDGSWDSKVVRAGSSK